MNNIIKCCCEQAEYYNRINKLYNKKVKDLTLRELIELIKNEINNKKGESDECKK